MSLSIYSSGIKFGPNSTNCSQNKSNLNGLVCFTENSINRGQVCEAVFDDCSVNFGTGDIGVFVGTSVNQGVTEAAVFSGNAVNVGVIASATFLGSAVNSGSVITGTFSETSKNAGYICVAQFEANALNSGFVSGTASFAGSAVNAGSVSGVASFAGGATNSGTLVCGGQRTFYIQDDSKSLTPGVTGYGLLSEINLSGKCLWSNSSLTNGQQITECSFYYENSCYYANSSGRVTPFLSTCNLCDFCWGNCFETQNPQLTNKIFYFSASDFPISFKTPSHPCDPTGLLCMTGDVLNFSGKRVYLDKALTTVRTGFNFHFTSALPNPNKTNVDGKLCGFWVDVSGRVSGAYALWPTGGNSFNTYNCALNYTGYPLYHSTGSTSLHNTIIYSDAGLTTRRTGVVFTAYRKEEFLPSSCLYNTTGEVKVYTTNNLGVATQRDVFSGCVSGSTPRLFFMSSGQNRNPDGKILNIAADPSTTGRINFPSTFGANVEMAFCTGSDIQDIYRASYPENNVYESTRFIGNTTGLINAFKTFTGSPLTGPFYFCTGAAGVSNTYIHGVTGFSDKCLISRTNYTTSSYVTQFRTCFFELTGCAVTPGSFTAFKYYNNSSIGTGLGVFNFMYSSFSFYDILCNNSGVLQGTVYLTGESSKIYTGNALSGSYVYTSQTNTTGINGLAGNLMVFGAPYVNRYIVPGASNNYIDGPGFHLNSGNCINSTDRYYVACKLNSISGFGCFSSTLANPCNRTMFSRDVNCKQLGLWIDNGNCDNFFRQNIFCYTTASSGNLTSDTDTSCLYRVFLTGSNIHEIYNLTSGKFTPVTGYLITGMNVTQFTERHAFQAETSFKYRAIPWDHSDPNYSTSGHLAMVNRHGFYVQDFWTCSRACLPQPALVELSGATCCVVHNVYQLSKDLCSTWTTGLSSFTNPILAVSAVGAGVSSFCPSFNNTCASIFFSHSFTGWGGCPIASGYGAINFVTGSSFITTGSSIVTSGVTFYAGPPAMESPAGGFICSTRKPNITGKFLGFNGIPYRINCEGKLTPTGWNPSLPYCV